MDLQQQELFSDEINKSIRNQAMLDGKVIYPYLTRLEKIFVTANKGDKLITIKEKKALRKLLDIITKAYANAGMRISAHSRSHQYDILCGITRITYGQLMDNYPHITMEEVELAVSNGIKHAYGDFHSINALCITNFIDKFLHDPDRGLALRKQNQYLQSQVEKPEPVKSEDESASNCFNLLIERYRNTGILIDPGSVAYDYALKKSIIVLTDEQRKKIYQQAVIESDIEEANDIINNGLNKYQKMNEDAMRINYIRKAREIVLRHYCDYKFLNEKGKLKGEIDLSLSVEDYLQQNQ